ncbi:MAG: PadR family transcriptional regulator [Streptosporangiales bacterium]|nr:PadR family transcriptional regulator [Streptosporangiales bacterium]
MAGRRDLVALTVLALLAQGPRHPYEMHRMIRQYRKDYITGLPRSLYHAVDRLTRDELVEPAETSREGRRPERTVYRITDEGRAELRGRLVDLLERPDRDTQLFSAALSLIGGLEKETLVYALRHRLAALEGAVAAAEAGAAELSRALPRILLVETEYERAMDQAEATWVRSLLADLEEGRLDTEPHGDARPEGGGT